MLKGVGFISGDESDLARGTRLIAGWFEISGFEIRLFLNLVGAIFGFSEVWVWRLDGRGECVGDEKCGGRS